MLASNEHLTFMFMEYLIHRQYVQ